MIEELVAAAQNETLLRVCSLLSGILVGPLILNWLKELEKRRKKNP